MKRFFLLVFLLIGQILFCQLMSQTLTESAISQKYKLISDSIKIYQKRGDSQRVLSICENGLSLLTKNNFYYTPASCILNLQAGASCIDLKNYQYAKFYYYNSFVLDELGEFGIGAYSTIVNKIGKDKNIGYFKDLLDLAKSDTIYLKMLALEPNKLVNRLNNSAWDNYNRGEYSSAINFFEMEISLLDALGQTGDENYLSIIPCEIMCIKELRNYRMAKSLSDYYLDLVKAFKGDNTIVYAEALQTKAGVEDEFGNSIEAIKLLNESLSLIERIKGKNNIEYIRCLRQVGHAFQNKDNNYIKFLEKELEIEKLLPLTATATINDKVENLQMLSHLYSLAGNNAKHLMYAEKAVSILEEDGQTNNANYAYQLLLLSSAHRANHSFDKAIELGEKSVSIYSQINRTTSQENLYIQSIGDLSSTYFESGDIDKAITTLKPLLSDDYPDNEIKFTHLKQIITYYQRAGLYDLMKTSCEYGLKLAEKLGGKKTELYADALFYASMIQDKKGDAILMLQEAANIYREKYGENNDSYISTKKLLHLLGTSNNKEKEQSSIMNKYESLYGKNSRKYFDECINYLIANSLEYKELNDINSLYKTTLQLDSLSQKICASFSENDELFLSARRNLAQMNINCFKMTLDTVFYNRGVNIQNDVLSLASSLYGENNIKYIREISNLAHLKSSICNLYYITHPEESSKLFDFDFFTTENGSQEAWKYYESTLFSKYCLEIQELQHRVVDYFIQLGDRNSSNYANACENLADFYSQEINNFPIKSILSLFKPEDIIKNNINSKCKKAELLYKEALDIYNGIRDFNSASGVLLSLSFLYEDLNEHIKSANALAESFKLKKNETLKQMSLMTTNEKSKIVFDDYWQSEIDHYNSKAYYNFRNDSCSSIYAKLSYDVQLLTKGLLLKSEIALRDLILSTNNSSVINKFNRLTEIKKLLSNPSQELNRDILHEEHQKLERLIMKESEIYGNYMNDFLYTFTDVKSYLGKDDVAIEFAAIHSPLMDENNKLHYFALVLKHDYSSPKIIKLESKFSLDSIYQKVWEPLYDEIKDMKNVYFSPTYDLNNLPLESAKLPNGSYISDLGINFYRISSTREIIKQRENNICESAVLYGGLNYNADIKDLIASDTEERSNGLRGQGSLNDDIENDLRQGKILWKYLVGTKIEVSKISKIAADFGVKTKLLPASKGTESTFKNLSGKMIDIIHIATHGFYIKPLNNNIEENQMERSGLALAGANHVHTGTILPEGVDDGILTADEISRLDLRGMDLIVLSACETGLGDITGEGVYGLQRGFKKAGVNSILMSLWKVDDNATQMLMVEFYRNFLKGETKIKSLLKAQQYVKSQRGWEDPKYWAGFILLDAIN